MDDIRAGKNTTAISPSPRPPLSPSPKAVITGVGCVTPLGEDRESTWRTLLAGEGAARRLRLGDLHGLGEARWPAIEAWGAPVPLAHAASEPLITLMRAAVADAASQANLARGDFLPSRAGCVIGTSKGEIVALGRMARGDCVPDHWESLWPQGVSSNIAREWSLAGPSIVPVAACATGLVCVLRAAELIENGLCDIVIAGSADASLQPAILAAFRRMGVLSKQFDDPAGVCRPFQVGRDGFYIGEGAAAFVIESREHARRRGAEPLARWRGGMVLSDPSGLTRVDRHGESLAEAIRRTLISAGIAAGAIRHINLHGTATVTNDLAEAAALRSVFGDKLGQIPSVALKPALGHLLGAAGAVELAISTLAVARGELPPSLIRGPLDPACALPLARNRIRADGCGLKLSLGFGGHIAVGCLEPA